MAGSASCSRQPFCGWTHHAVPNARGAQRGRRLETPGIGFVATTDFSATVRITRDFQVFLMHSRETTKIFFSSRVDQFREQSFKTSSFHLWMQDPLARILPVRQVTFSVIISSALLFSVLTHTFGRSLMTIPSG